MRGLYERTKALWWSALARVDVRLHAFVFRYRAYVKYVLAGTTAAAVNLGLLALFKEAFGMYYLLASTLSFLAAFFVSFFLQKFWTFGHTSLEDVRRQLGKYFGIAVGNLGLNALLMFVLVDFVRLWYLFSQVLSSGSIAVMSFLLYRRYVFIRPAKQDK